MKLIIACVALVVILGSVWAFQFDYEKYTAEQQVVEELHKVKLQINKENKLVRDKLMRVYFKECMQLAKGTHYAVGEGEENIVESCAEWSYHQASRESDYNMYIK